MIVLFALAALVPGAAAAQNPSEQDGNDERLLQRLDPTRVSRNPETGKVALIGASKTDPISRPEGLSPDASPAVAARAHLTEVGPLFGVEDQSRELNLQSTEAIGKGRFVTRFRQVYKDVPVLGGEIHVQTNGSNELLSANGEALPDISLDTEPGVSAGEARDAALASTAKQYEQNTGELDATEPELWIYDAGILGGPGPERPALVWRLEVKGTGGPPINELVLVDAQLGSVALSIDQIENAKNRQVCDAANTSAQYPCTAPVRVEGGPAHSVPDVNLAYDFAGDTYDFYNANHARDSIDNAGMTLKSTVRYCDPSSSCPYQNAFWDGQQMVYGQGFAAADDVVGHELTHGVTEYESHLFYYYQSGAINESFSDVWGEFVDLTNASGTDTAATRWQMGEDVPGFGALRDMEDPGVFGDPDRMQSPNYTADANEQDGGGVHTNSGVNNKAAYLITDGGTFNGRTVTGLGITKTTKIYYEVQANLLTSAGDYNDLHAALRQACANLTGTSGITAADCGEVADAVNATEMNLQPTTAPATDAPVCATGESATNLFSDDLENPASGNWTKTGNWFYPQNPNALAGFDATYATSGTTNFWGYNQPTTGDYAIARTANVTPPTGKTTYLRFNHAYGFEDDVSSAYDGGVLEYSTNNGTSWTDAGSLITDNGYTGTISSSFGNPLAGRQAFVRESNGYISSRVNLSSLAGQSVRFRFRIGTDSSVDDYGWFVDDVRVYTCATNIDTTKPRVTRVVPAENATGVAPTANVLAVFSEPMRATSVIANVKLFKVGSTTALPATVTYDATARRATLNPNANLQLGAKYKTVVSTGTRDTAGNQLDQDPSVTGNQPKVWFFTIRN